MSFSEKFKVKIEEFILNLKNISKIENIDINNYILANEFHVLWINKGKKDFQLIISTNNENINDIKVNLFGPFNISKDFNNCNLDLDKIKEFFNGKHIKKNDQSKFIFLEDKFFNDYIHQIDAFELENLITQKFPQDDIYYIISFYNILDSSAKTMAEDFRNNLDPDFLDLYDYYKDIEEIECIGSRLTPQIEIVDLNDKELLRCNVPVHKILIEKNGLIYVEGEDFEKGLSYLNIFNSILLLNGVIFNKFIRSEIYGTRLLIKENEIVEKSDHFHKAFQQKKELYNPFYLPKSMDMEVYFQDYLSKSNKINKNFPKLKKDIFERSFEVFAKVISSDKLKNWVLDFYEIAGLYNQEQFKQTFITCWSIIEEFIADLYEIVTKNNQNNLRLLRKNLTAHKKIEYLHNNNMIQVNEYNKIMRFKAIRNKLVHKNQNIDEFTTKEIINLVYSIIMNTFDSFHL